MSRERGRASAWEHTGVARRLEPCTPSHSHSWRLWLQGGWSLCLTTVSESLAGAGRDRVGVYSQPPLWKRPAGSATTPALTRQKAGPQLRWFSKSRDCGCLGGRGRAGSLPRHRVGERSVEETDSGCLGIEGLDWCLSSCGNGWLGDPGLSTKALTSFLIPGNNDPVATATRLINDFIWQNKAPDPS